MDIGLQIAAGLVLLALGGEGLIRGAVGLARRFGLSELLIGLVLVGFGTSAPELITSIDAALAGSPGVAIGNVLGSNVSNVLLILAIVVMIRPIAVDRAAVGRDGAMVVAVSMLIAGLGLVLGGLDRPTGAVLVAILAAYVAFVWLQARKGGAAAAVHVGEVQTHDPAPQSLWLSAPFALGGLGLLLYGADLLVTGSIAAARLAGVSETTIGLTVVALGTSLPELVATLAAALKGRADVAFGSIAGSNVYNLLGILGMTALVRPLAMPADIGLADWSVLVGSAVLLVVFAVTGRRISRLEGAVLAALYLAYMAYRVL